MNNAGISQVLPLADLTIDSFDKIFEINVRASLALTLNAVPYLVKSKGNIVNVSSVSSYTPVSCFQITSDQIKKHLCDFNNF